MHGQRFSLSSADEYYTLVGDHTRVPSHELRMHDPHHKGRLPAHCQRLAARAAASAARSRGAPPRGGGDSGCAAGPPPPPLRLDAPYEPPRGGVAATTAATPATGRVALRPAAALYRVGRPCVKGRFGCRRCVAVASGTPCRDTISRHCLPTQGRGATLPGGPSAAPAAAAVGRRVVAGALPGRCTLIPAGYRLAARVRGAAAAAQDGGADPRRPTARGAPARRGGRRCRHGRHPAGEFAAAGPPRGAAAHAGTAAAAPRRRAGRRWWARGAAALRGGTAVCRSSGCLVCPPLRCAHALPPRGGAPPPPAGVVWARAPRRRGLAGHRQPARSSSAGIAGGGTAGAAAVVAGVAGVARVGPPTGRGRAVCARRSEWPRWRPRVRRPVGVQQR